MNGTKAAAVARLVALAECLGQSQQMTIGILHQELPLLTALHLFAAIPRVARSKIIVLDDRLVVTGSFDFTKAADTRNAENVVMIDSKTVAA